MDNDEPSESVVYDDYNHNVESTKSDAVPEVNDSSKKSKKSKRTQWFNVRTILY